MKKDIKKKVLYCLEKHPDTRNSDTKLTNSIWIEFYKEYLFQTGDGSSAIKILDLYKIPTQDDVKRWRAKIQNQEHKFVPTEWSVAKQRKMEEEEWRRALGYNPELRTV